ncbi:putative Ion transport domain-containing protein [Dioscorea sansibarensis]
MRVLAFFGCYASHILLLLGPLFLLPFSLIEARDPSISLNRNNTPSMLFTPSTSSSPTATMASASRESSSHSHHPSCVHYTKGSGEDVDEGSIRAAGSRKTGQPLMDARWTQEWNRVFVLVCAAGLIVDPLFFYALSISEARMCLYVDGWFSITVTALRCMTDAVHLWNMWLRLRSATRMRRPDGDEGSRLGRGHRHYLVSMRGFFFDLFVILPVPQRGGHVENLFSRFSLAVLSFLVPTREGPEPTPSSVVLWVAAPSLIRKGSTMTVMTVILIMFLFQYLPKIYHSLCFLRRMQNSSGYIFGTIWWGIALNLIAYFVASHAAGACWYLLGIQRATKCLREQCMTTQGCGLKTVACVDPIYYGTTTTAMKDWGRLHWAKNMTVRTTCLDSSDNFEYGAYKWTVPLFTKTNRAEKILLPIFWGLMTLSTFGTLESTTEWLEIVFNIIIVTSGLLLVTMLIGNIKVSNVFVGVHACMC